MIPLPKIRYRSEVNALVRVMGSTEPRVLTTANLYHTLDTPIHELHSQAIKAIAASWQGPIEITGMSMSRPVIANVIETVIPDK